MSVYVEEVTRADCKKNNFSGLRSDRILCNMEIWKAGVMVYESSAAEMATNPERFKQAYAEAFGLYIEQVEMLDIIPRS